MPSVRKLGAFWPVPVLIGLVMGQVLRVPILPGGSGSISLIEVGIGVAVLTGLFELVRAKQLGECARFVWRNPIWRWSAFFLLWAAMSLALNALNYTGRELLVAISYLVRLACTIALIWLAAFYRPPVRHTVVIGFLAAAGTLTVLGFLQYVFINDFRFMETRGWDPHVGRLLSTFYDPNYFGVFLVLVMAAALATAFSTTGRKHTISAALFGAAWIALYLTFSRSAWLAGLIAIVGMSLKRNWRLSLGILVVFVGVLFVPSRLSERFQSTASIADSQNNVGGTYQCDEFAQNANCDNSGAKRIDTYKKGLELVTASPLIGVGYNAYGYALVERGVITKLNESAHSAQGSDSSVLNIAATTGVIGLGLATVFFVKVALALRRRVQESGDWVAHGLLWFTVAWAAASVVNNVIFYTLILAPWALLVGAILAVPDVSNVRKRKGA